MFNSGQFLTLSLFICMTGCADVKQSFNIPDLRELIFLTNQFVRPREVELKITYTLKNITACDTNTVTLYEFSEAPVSWVMEKKSSKPVLLLYIARQRDLPNQRNVEYISIDPQPDQIVSKDVEGNIIEFWDLSGRIQEGKDITITRHFRFTAYETAFKIEPARVGDYEPADPLYRYYTRTQEFMELTPEVSQLAHEIVGKEKNPYLKAKAIYQWCMENIGYVYPPNRGIRYSLPRKTGDCGEYSLIFAALCRSVGIPVRIANGHWCCKEKLNYHVWNEFYLPNYGWVPADATFGRVNLKNPDNPAGKGDPFYFFGNLDSGRFISSKGTSIQLYPSPPWHMWGLADTNKNPIFFQTAATVYANLKIEKEDASVEIIVGDESPW